jgi:hypothetical protein
MGLVTHVENARGFMYTIFGLGASHMGFRAGLWGKACLARAHELLAQFATDILGRHSPVAISMLWRALSGSPIPS